MTHQSGKNEKNGDNTFAASPKYLSVKFTFPHMEYQ